MNIAILNTLAKTGSTGKITYGYQQYLKNQGHNAYIFYGRDDEKVSNDEKDIIRVGTNTDLRIHACLSRITGMQGIYSKHATKRMLQQFKELRIDAVCMFNLHGYYLDTPALFKWLGKNQIPCEYVMLDEYPFLGKCAYSFECDRFKTECKNCPRVKEHPKSLFFDSSTRMFHLKQEMYGLVHQCVFVGIEYTVNRAKESAITRNCRFAIADEAIDLRNLFYPRDTSKLRKKLKIPDGNKIVLTVAAYPNERKGSQYFLEAAKRMTEDKDITFVHVGFKADTSICPPNYVPIGFVKDQDLLAQYYSLGDLFVQTSTAETIPASILEALACGTPILGFNCSGIPYTADAEHGTFVEPCNIEEMIRIIKETPIKSQERITSCREYAKSRFDSVDYARKLLDVLKYGEVKK